MKFSEWLLLEEEKARVFKKPNPKNPSQFFVVIYGNTYPIKDQLKKMGFRYFKGTWSTLESKLTDSLKSELINLGVDLSGLDEPIETQKEPDIKQNNQENSKTDQILQNMKDNLESAMKSEGSDSKLKNLVANIERMIEKIANSTDEASKQEFIKNFLKFSSKFHNYSYANQILIWVQTKGKAQHVASATNWTKLGRSVRDWDEGIMIFAPNFKKIEKENKLTGEKEKVELKFFKSVKVYDISSTVPIPGNKNVFQPLQRKDWSKDSNDDVEELNVLINSLISWVKEKNINLDYEEMSDEMGGYSSGGKVAINNKFKGINLFSTLVHETAHELLHWLDNKKLDKESSKRQKEIDAETTAFVVCHHFGFDTKDAPNYLALWQAKGDDIRARKQNIHKASKLIIHGIENKITETEIEFEDEDADLEVAENSQINDQPKIIFTGWVRDGRILAIINGKRKVFVTDAIHHNRFRKMKPELAYKHILKLIDNGRAYELENKAI